MAKKNDDFDIEIPSMVKWQSPKKQAEKKAAQSGSAQVKSPQEKDSRQTGNNYNNVYPFRPPQNRPPQKRPPQNRPPQNRPPQNRSSQNRPPQNRPPQNRAPQNRPPQNIPPQDRSSQNRPADNVTPQNKFSQPEAPRKFVRNEKTKKKSNRTIQTIYKDNSVLRKYPWLPPFVVGFIIFLIIMIIAFSTGIAGGSDKPNEEKEKNKTNIELPLTEAANMGNVQSNMKAWSGAEGGIIQDENVMNVLLLGIDDSDGNSRSDSMMILSLNKSKKQLNIFSIYRDSYSYIKIDDEKERFNKITAAYQFGGGELSSKTVERLFKIKIDHYVAVNFETFPAIIDALGGITLDVEEYEAKHIRQTSRHKEMPMGKDVTLTGDQALVYARIRKCDADSDVSRTRRQRKVVESLIKKMQAANVSQIVGLADKIFPYVVTDFSKSEIVSTGTAALAQKWTEYERHQYSCMTSGTDGWPEKINDIGDIWAVDYPACAKRMQEIIYGRSAITLQGGENGRVTPKDLFDDNKIFE